MVPSLFECVVQHHLVLECNRFVGCLKCAPVPLTHPQQFGALGLREGVGEAELSVFHGDPFSPKRVAGRLSCDYWVRRRTGDTDHPADIR